MPNIRKSNRENPPDVLIYGLCDPRNGELVYVGATTQSLKLRLANHVGERLDVCGNPVKKAWTWELHDAGLKPEAFEIETVPFDVARESEKFWIHYYYGIGCCLMNTRGISGRMQKRCKPWDDHRKAMYKFHRDQNTRERKGLPLLSYSDFALMNNISV